MNFDDLVTSILSENNLKPKVSEEDIAKKHGVSVSEVKAKLKAGTEVEKEHTKDHATAETIASQHVYEVLDYYDKLKKVEKTKEV
jgi:hypothetical protein